MVASRSLQSGTLAPSMTAASGPPCSSTSRLFLVPGLPRSVGFLPTFFPPETGLAHAPVCTLPLPVDLLEFVTRLDEHRPDSLHHPVAAPSLEPAVDCGVVAEPLGHLVPLAAATEAMNDPVDEPPPIGWRLPTPGARLPVLLEDGLDPRPKLVVDFPDRFQRLRPCALPCHDGAPPWC